MCKMGCFFIVASLVVINIVCVSSVTVPIVPSHLWSCYRQDGPNISAPHRLDVFLSALKKLEAHESQLDIRRFSVAFLRSLRLDGIEQAANALENQYNIPYRATAFQFQRFKLLMDLFLPGSSLSIIDEDLTEYEKCYLHKMISVTVERWERGDENSVCPRSMSDQNNLISKDEVSQRGYSRCPIERGVLQTEYGSVAIGTVIAAIATALEHQNVLVTDILNTDTIRKQLIEKTELEALDFEETNKIASAGNAYLDNVWIATIAGDLAEVAVNQGPQIGAVSQKIDLGSNSIWNDTLLPRNHYLLIQNETTVNWHFSDAEILAGIDGFIIASEISKWVSERSSLKLSQIIDMYYSDYGISFNRDLKACNRKSNFMSLYNKEELLEEVKNFGNILAISQGTVVVANEQFNRICEAVTEAFSTYLTSFFEKHNYKCLNDLSKSTPSAMELIVTMDGSWKAYEATQFISKLLETLKISLSESSVGLIHGGTGHWIFGITPNMTSAFSELNHYSGEWPNRLDFPQVLSSINVHLASKLTSNETRAHVAIPTVVLVVTPTDRLSDGDIQTSRSLLTSIRNSHLDVYFIYVAQDLSGYKTCTEIYNENYLDFYVQLSSTSVDDALMMLEREMTELKIPKRIIPTNCNGSLTDNVLPSVEFVLPDEEVTFSVNPIFVNEAEVAKIQFKTIGQGQIRICESCDINIEKENNCRQLNLRESVEFNVTNQCGSSPKYFTITGLVTSNDCVSDLCRLPYQIGYTVEQNALKCGQDKFTINKFLLMLFFSLWIFRQI